MVAGIDDAGLVIGVASFALEAFEGLKKGFAYFEDAVNMPEHCASYKLQLRMEYSKLRSWADLSGLTTDQEKFNLRVRVDRITIMAVFNELRMSLKRLRKLSLRYEDIQIDHDPDPTYIGQSTAESKRGFSEKDMSGMRRVIDSTPRQVSESLRSRATLSILKLCSGIKEVMQHPKRLRWALKDREGFDRELSRFTTFVNSLQDILDESQMSLLLQNTQETTMALLQLSSTVSELGSLLKASTFEQNYANDFPSSSSHTLPNANADVQGSLLLQMRLERLIEFSIQHIKVLSVADETVARVQLADHEASRISVQAEASDLRTPTEYHGRGVWVEWRSYMTVWNQDAFRYEPDPRSLLRLQQLVALLVMKERPREFCIPTCLGYFQDPDPEKKRFGMVFEFPPDEPLHGAPVSLYQLLEGTATTGLSLPPTIRQRVRLALDIATYLLYLHAVKWSHKGFRSTSVLFPSSDKATADISRPYVSGFDYSRPELEPGNAIETTPAEDLRWDFYWHPEYRREDGRFRAFERIYDIYSLGIVLLEIAHWQTAAHIFTSKLEASDVISDGASVPGAVSRAIRDYLLEPNSHVLHLVRMNMGDLYYDAVNSCVSEGDFPRYNAVDNSDSLPSKALMDALSQQVFLRNVIDKLRAIVV